MATRIRRLRQARFLTQVELAKKARVHPISLVRIETGAATPRVTTLRRLAKALCVDVAELVS